MSAARRLVSSTLAAWGAQALDDDARLLVSELVTNAVIHAGTEVDVTLALLAGSVEVGVADQYPSRTVAAPPAFVSENSESSRGMLLVEAIASAWGIDYTDRTKRVWFRLAHTNGPQDPRTLRMRMTKAPATRVRRA